MEPMQQTGQSGLGTIPSLIFLAIGILLIVSVWKMFTKAGKPGWASLIPVYNTIVMLEVAGKPGWWVIFYFIPVVNFVIHVIAMLGLAKNFGRGAGFAIGLLFLSFIFVPILAFSGMEYIGPGGEATAPEPEPIANA